MINKPKNERENQCSSQESLLIVCTPIYHLTIALAQFFNELAPGAVVRIKSIAFGNLTPITTNQTGVVTMRIENSETVIARLIPGTVEYINTDILLGEISGIIVIKNYSTEPIHMVLEQLPVSGNVVGTDNDSDSDDASATSGSDSGSDTEDEEMGPEMVQRQEIGEIEESSSESGSESPASGEGSSQYDSESAEEEEEEQVEPAKRRREPEPATKKARAEPESESEQEEEEIVKGPRGIRWVNQRAGKGPEARKGMTAHIQYVGRLSKNNKVFDRSNAPFKFKIGAGEVIEGMDIGVQGMRAGGKRVILIPAKMAYGRTGAPPEIPPMANLVFEITLVKCTK